MDCGECAGGTLSRRARIGRGTGGDREPVEPLKRVDPIMSVAMPKPTQDDWVKTVLFDRGYLARIRGEAIKVYLAIIEACGGVPDRSVTMSLSLSCGGPIVVPDGDRQPVPTWRTLAWSSQRPTSAAR